MKQMKFESKIKIAIFIISLIACQILMSQNKAVEFEIALRERGLNKNDRQICGTSFLMESVEEIKNFNQDLRDNRSLYKPVIEKLLCEAIDEKNINFLDYLLGLIQPINDSGLFDDRIADLLFEMDETFPTSTSIPNQKSDPINFKRTRVLVFAISCLDNHYHPNAVEFCFEKLKKANHLNFGSFMIYIIRSCYNRENELRRLDAIIQQMQCFQDPFNYEYYKQQLKRHNAVIYKN